MGSIFLDQRVIDRAALTPAAPAVGTPGRWYSYRELAEAVERLSGALRSHGVGPGGFVLNALPAGPASVAAGLAVQRAGACLVELHSKPDAATIAEAVGLTNAHHAFVPSRDAAKFATVDNPWSALWIADPAAATAAGGRYQTLDGMFRVVGVDRAAAEAPRPVRRPDDLALLLFTSGSTARPRGVMLSYRNIAANTQSIVSYLRITAEDRVMSTLPLSYCYGRSLLQTHLWAGASVCFEDFIYPQIVLRAIGSEGCTAFAGVPLTFEMLRRRCDPRTIAMGKLRLVTQAGGAMSVELRRWAREAFAPAEFEVMYGQTEATARLAYLSHDAFADKPDSVGRAIPGVELRVVNDEGRSLPDGATGNLIARGDNVCMGYLGAPEETRQILRDGWLWTGDLARRDADGFFFIEGRTRAMLKVSGHRFAPAAVEERLARHPSVREACVVGVPDPLTGDLVHAFVVVRDGVAADTLRRFCAEALPPYQVPGIVTAVDVLPRCPAGKVQRGVLERRAREAAAACIGADDV